MQSQGAVVGFLGDGVNDAPALRQADLGLCVANGSELSWEVADVVLLRPGLGPARMAFELAQASWTRLRLNLGLALLYNALAIPSAALGWVTPLAAAIAMPLSSLAVLANSLYLLALRRHVFGPGTGDALALPAGALVRLFTGGYHFKLLERGAAPLVRRSASAGPGRRVGLVYGGCGFATGRSGGP